MPLILRNNSLDTLERHLIAIHKSLECPLFLDKLAGHAGTPIFLVKEASWIKAKGSHMVGLTGRCVKPKKNQFVTSHLNRRMMYQIDPLWTNGRKKIKIK